MKFDLTETGASLYESLLENGKLTGYEAAKLTGISRSNIYASLASLCARKEQLIWKKMRQAENILQCGSGVL